MFTGIIQEKVALVSLKWDSLNPHVASSCQILVESKHPQRKSWLLGDSIAFDGVCLTIVSLEHSDLSSRFAFDVSKETLSKTHFKKTLFNKEALSVPRLKELHLEPALKMGDSLGGHLVSGHVEGVARLLSKKEDQNYLALEFLLENENKKIAPFLISKGSVALDGTSLTLNEVRDEKDACIFTIYLIPHTLEKCHFGLLEVGDEVNVESDLMARHFCRYQSASKRYEE